MPVAKGLKKTDAWNTFLKTVITEIDKCHFLLVREIWCSYFNVDVNTIIFYHSQIKPLKRVVYVIALKKMKNLQLLQNVAANLLRSIYS